MITPPEKAPEQKADDEPVKNGGIYNGEPKKSDDKSTANPTVADLESGMGVGSGGSSGNTESAAADGLSSLYNPSTNAESNKIFNKLKSSFSSSKNKKTWYAGFGLMGVVGILTIGSLFSFLNVFKLNHFMKNVESKTMVRYMSAVDHRSSKWIEAYVKIRLTSLEPDGSDSVMFRSDKVDTNNPVQDWYKTMRTSSFERDLAKKGITFTNYTDGPNRGFAIVSVDKKIVAAGIQNPDVKTASDLNKYIEKNGGLIDIAQDFDLDKPGDAKAARQAIKKIVNEETNTWNVVKRRQLRKSIQNTTGIRDWRFFEKTQEKYEAKKADIRKKIITSVLPESTKSGKLLGCLLGYNDCSNTTSDPADPKNKSSGTPNATPKDNNTEVDNPEDPNNPDAPKTKVPNKTGQIAEEAIGSTDKLVSESFAKTLKELMGKFSPATSIASFMDTLVKIHKAMQTGALSKLVYTAKLTALIATYQKVGTMADQQKSGELSAHELNDTMRYFNDIGNNDGWSEVITKNTSVTALAENAQIEVAKNKETYCSKEYQAIVDNPDNYAITSKGRAYLCDSDKPNGGGTAAAGIEGAWNKSVGPFIEPIAKSYDALGVGKIMGWVNSAADWATGWAVNGLIKATGFGDNIESFMASVLALAAKVLGASPLVTTTTSGAKMGAYIIAGGAGAQSVAMRDNGAITSTQATMVESNKLAAKYEANKKSTESIYDKYFSTENPDSIASKGLYNTATVLTGGGITHLITSYFGNIGNALSRPLSFNANAAANAYAGDTYGGIDSYDFSTECLDQDPLTATPANSTNIIKILGADKVKESELTWDVLTKSDSWYSFVYSHVDQNKPNADELTKKIYNCQLLDNSARGGLGYTHGYTNDDGLDSTSNGNVAMTEISFASYNIRNANSSQGDPVKNEKPWSTRSAAVTQVIEQNYAEIWGFQEVWTNAQVESLQASLRGAYDHTVSVKDANDTAIFYDNSKYRPIDTKSQGEFELKFYNKHKYCAWIGLERVIDNQKFYVYNCHLIPGDGSGPNKSRLDQLHEIVTHMKKTNTENYPVVLMGDFNLNNNDKPSEGKYDAKHVKYLEDNGFKDTYDMANASVRKNDNCNTFNDFDSTYCKKNTSDRGSQLDRIYLNPGGLPLQVSSRKVVIDKYNNIWPSDHNAVQATLSLASQSSSSSSGATVNADGWVWPLKNVHLGGCFYEDYGDHMHAGIDFRASTGTDVYAVADGTIDGFNTTWGMIRLKHNTPDGVVYSVYEHMLNDKFTKQSGTVKAGEKIGESDNTAPPKGSSGPHLHLTLTKDPGKWDSGAFGTNTLINPLKYLNGNKDFTSSGSCSASPEYK